MPRAIRFHLDENIDARIDVALRQHGIDVTTAARAGLLHATDEEHLAFARSEGRVIFTQDADFLRFNAAGLPHSGIAYCHPTSRSLGELVQSLILMWEIYEPHEVKDRVEFL